MGSSEIEAVVEAVTDKDRIWFRGHPCRNFRVRATPADTEMAARQIYDVAMGAPA